MASNACKWGATCTRRNCWFTHPERSSSSSGFPTKKSSTKPVTQEIECRFGHKCHRADCYFKHPQGRLIDGPPFVTRSSSEVKEQQEVKMVMEKEKQQQEVMIETDKKEAEKEQQHMETTDDVVASADMLEMMEEQQTAIEMENKKDDTWKDEWYAASRDCACCKGFIYKCKVQEIFCQSGECFCSTTS